MTEQAISTVGMFTFWDYVVMIGYIVGIAALGFGVTLKSKEKSTKDYLLGGRNIPWWAITLSLFATLFSAISFTAIPEEAYKHGMRLWLGGVIALPMIPLALWMFLGFYYKLKSFTPYSYIEKRFNPSVRLLASVIFMIQRGLYLAVVIYASARAFNIAVGWDMYFTILLVGILGTLYTTVGGLRAVVWTDVAQFFVMLAGILFVAIFLCYKVDGGLFGIVGYAFENGRGLNISESFFTIDPHERVTLWWLILGGLFTTLNYYATDQLVVQRLLSTRSYKDAKKAAFSNIPVSFVVGLCFWFIGLGLFAFYHQSGAAMLAKVGDRTQVFPFFIATELPVPVPGLIMAALLAAIMSTIDSGINSLATVFVKDVYARFINKKATEQQEVKVSKIMTIFWGVFMIMGASMFVFISESATSTIMETNALWASMGGIVLSIYILAVTTTHIGSKGIWIACSCGVVALLIGVVNLHYMTPKDMRISFMLVGNIGTFVTLGIGISIAFWAKLHKRPVETVKTDGLTLWSINRKQLNNEDK